METDYDKWVKNGGRDAYGGRFTEEDIKKIADIKTGIAAMGKNIKEMKRELNRPPHLSHGIYQNHNNQNKKANRQ